MYLHLHVVLFYKIFNQTENLNMYLKFVGMNKLESTMKTN